MDTVKNCSTCKHHRGYSIDDVANECYPCVWAERSLGYFPGWEAKEEEPIIFTTDGEEKYLAWQGYDKIVFEKPMNDNVNHPSHYKTGGIETIDYIRAKLGDEGTVAYCMGNVMKYTSRWQDKNGLEDLKKADWYLDYAISILESASERKENK